MTMAISGAGMLWVGWFGFNGGSALTADGNAAMAMLVTHIAAAAGAMAWLSIRWKRFGKPSAWAPSPVWWPDWVPLPRLRFRRTGRCAADRPACRRNMLHRYHNT